MQDCAATPSVPAPGQPIRDRHAEAALHELGCGDGLLRFRHDPRRHACVCKEPIRAEARLQTLAQRNERFVRNVPRRHGPEQRRKAMVRRQQ